MIVKEGDVVRLKSGGPKMMVTHILESDDDLVLMDVGFKAGDVSTEWFIGSTSKRNTFKATSLMICE